MRLGELLVEAGTLTVEQVDEALRAQVIWGGRLGTNLVELGLVDLDSLARVLGRQVGLPGALAAHFDRADRALQLTLTPEVAERYLCVPLLRAGTRIVVATTAPLDEEAIAAVADDLVIEPDRIVLSIAPEQRISFHLERIYGIPRDQRFLRSRNVKSQSQLFQLRPSVDPAFDFAPPAALARAAVASPAIPDDATLVLAEPTDASEPEAASAERRTYLRTLADMLQKHPSRDSVIAHVRRIGGSTDPVAPLRASSAMPPAMAFDASLVETELGRTLDDAIHSIHRAPDREQLARLVVGAVQRFLEYSQSALLLVVRGDAAVSWTGFCRDGTQLPALAVPLDHPGFLPAVMRRKVPVRGTAGDLGPIDYLLLASLGVQYGDLNVCPIAIAEHVMAMLVIATKRNGVVVGADSICKAAGVAFSRLMRHAGSA